MDRLLLQKTFEKGTLPSKLDGFYKGKLELFLPGNTLETLVSVALNLYLPWLGKSFSSVNNSGDNVLFVANFHAFPFKTKTASALRDKTKVLQISYDIPQNSPKVRKVVDELVMVSKNKYLGKAYIETRLVAFFSLEK